MSTKIALFNHKGGVSKTTTTFNLGWKLAELGHRVIIVDTDPQSNLTGLVLGFRGPDELEKFYQDEPGNNVHSALLPAFESRPFEIQPLECVPVDGRDGLFLLAGNIRFAEFETTLGIAQELTGSIQALQNIPGALAYLMNRTADHLGADYVLIDMSPGLGAINQNLIGVSDYFIVPATPDFFSVMAIDSLASVLPRWKKWAYQAAEMEILRDAAYPFPEAKIQFVGTVIQNYRPRGGAPAASFQRWIDLTAEAVRDRLIPSLKDAEMMLPDAAYAAADTSTTALNLVQIPDFNSLVALSQERQKPVYALTEEDTGRSGVVLEGTMRNRDQFDELFNELAQKVVLLTS